MAEAFFNEMAKGKARAFSAGTEPADSVNPVVVAAMKEAGIDLSRNKPKKLTLKMVEKADRMITMGCGDDAAGLCPAKIIETEDWALDDPKGQPLTRVREIRDRIKAKVAILLAEINT